MKNLNLFLFVLWMSSNSIQIAKAEIKITENIKFNSDFRFRHEMISRESKPEHHRQRMRTRVGVTVIPTDNITFDLQLASGSNDPVSTNQTIGSGFSTKTIKIDLAYMKISLSSFGENRNHLFTILGKQKPPFYRPGKSELIWDDDLRPEGLHFVWSPKLDWTKLRWGAYGFWVEERKTGPDSFLVGSDLSFNFPAINSDTSIGLGIGYFGYTYTKNQETFFDSTDSFGNSVNSLDQYATDFRLAEAMLEFNSKINGFPISIFLDYVINTAISQSNQGWLVGARFGKVKRPRDFFIRYNYRYLEKDAILGVFSDSDFNAGNTSGKGHELGVDVGIMEKVKSGITLFANSTTIDKSTDYYRVQADLSLKF